MKKVVFDLDMKSSCGGHEHLIQKGLHEGRPSMANQEGLPECGRKLLVVCRTHWTLSTFDESLRMNEIIRTGWGRPIRTMTSSSRTWKSGSVLGDFLLELGIDKEM